MKHIYRLLAAASAAALVYTIGSQEAVLAPQGIASLSGVTFLLAAFALYFNLILPRIQLDRVLGLCAGILCGLISGYLLRQLYLAFEPEVQTLSLLLYLIPVFFFSYVGFLTAPSLLSAKTTGSFSANQEQEDANLQPRAKLLDTSVIIDGRIMDIAETKFFEGPFIVPNYVLREIQLISDSSDSIKRSRGRRGLDMLNELQKRKGIEVKISYKDYTDIREVDAKLIRMSRELGCYLVTNDFNLNKVAVLQGVEVLNLNNLTNALKPIVLPGENINIDILREGKDENQGIGYMDDGTMVVVENGGPFLNKKVQVSVTSVIQTAAGKMIFTRAQNVIEDSPSSNEEERNSSSEGNNQGKNGRHRSGGRSRGGRSGQQQHSRRS